MNTFIEKALKWTILGGIFVLPIVPLIITQSMFFPFITGKNFFFRVVVELIAALWLMLALVSPTYRPKRSWLLGAFAIFIAIIAVADLQGTDPFKSFWSNFERMEGWVTLAHLFVLFVVMSSMLHVERLWRWFFATNIGISVIVGFYSILQFIGMIPIDQGSTRLDATLGNSTYLAVYMLFLLFITAMLWMQLWREGRRGWGWALGPIMALQFFSLFFTETRGAILGLFAGVLFSAFLMLFIGRESKVLWKASVGILGGFVVLVGLFFLLINTPIVQKVGPLHRLASISLTDDTTIARFMNWGMAWQGFTESPQRMLLGWGQSQYNVVFDKYYNPAMWAQEQWFDRVHNIVFDWLIAGGLLGFLAYCGIFVAALWMLWRSAAFTPLERALLTGLLAGYVVNNMVVFDNITSYLMFVFVLGYIAVRATREGGSPAFPARGFVPAVALPYLAAAGIVLGLGTVYLVNWNAYQQNRALLSAVSQSTPEASLDDFEKALSYNSLGEQETREQLVQIAMNVIGQTSIATSTRTSFYQLATSEMQKQMQEAPLDARFPLFLGALVASSGDATSALPSLEKAHDLSPAKQTISFQLALAQIALGQNDQAYQLLKQTYELDTSDTDAEAFYAMAAIYDGKTDEADQLVSDLAGKGIIADQRVVAAYAATKQYGKLISIWQGYLAAHPENLQAQFGLAAAYYQDGQTSKAISQLESIAASTQDASVKSEAQSLITQIRNGTLKVQ
ncbi:MAG TPA: O-antigen ligase family protein [Candidatus Paceibacterota bacterium]|nr:O-antigen ligase family protein [Candidatus Paceibacterota bacterium]